MSERQVTKHWSTSKFFFMQHLKNTTPISVMKQHITFPLLFKLLQIPCAYEVLSALQRPTNVFWKTTEKLKLLKMNS